MSGALRPYVIQQGDYLAKLAHRFGFDADSIWQDPKNADLRRLRKPNQLYPGDILHVPTSEEVALDLVCGTTNHYVAALPRVDVNLVFEVDGRPSVNEACVVEGLGAPLELATDGHGRLAFSVPTRVREVSVRFVKRKVIHAVRIGDMDPIEEASGVRAMLVHLRYLPEHDAHSQIALRAAVSTFQRDESLTVTGEMNDETRRALESAHGS